MGPAHADILQLVVDNYNSHKLEKNKELDIDHVIILSEEQLENGWHLFLTTKRNDGLMYEVITNTETEKTTLYLYNRIARKVLTKD